MPYRFPHPLITMLLLLECLPEIEQAKKETQSSTTNEPQDRRAAILVPSVVPADFANKHFGTAYGVDWQYEPPFPGSQPVRPEVLNAIERERAAQVRQWGGEEHDDNHNDNDFIGLMIKQLQRAIDLRGERRDRIVKVAALAVAALEMMARRAERVDKQVKGAAQNGYAETAAAQEDRDTRKVDSKALHAELSNNMSQSLDGPNGSLIERTVAGIAEPAQDPPQDVLKAANSFAEAWLDKGTELGASLHDKLPPGYFLHITVGRQT